MPNDEIRQNRTLSTLSPEAIPPSFTPAQSLAMAALLSGKSKTAAAQAAAVSRSTIHEWLASDPEFLAFYNSCRLELIEATQQSVLLLSADAVRTQRVLLRSRKTPPAVKARVAADVIRQMAKEVDGPTDPQDANNQINRKLAARIFEALNSADILKRAKEKEASEKSFQAYLAAKQARIEHEDDEDDEVDDDEDDLDNGDYEDDLDDQDDEDD